MRATVHAARAAAVLSAAALAVVMLAYPSNALGAVEPGGYLAPQKPSSPGGTRDSLNNIEFRNLGPAVAGGRVSSVVGVPGRPGLYYVGAAGGGVWKTTNGGNSWDPVFENQPVASIGAIALAPSNPNLVWVGTGEANIRNDITNGRGVYFSPDAGKTWQLKGLESTGQIAKIVIDPTNPDIVFVAAVGHAWTPNPDRGIYRTTDGGKTWSKVLFVNDTTGAIDIEMQPGNPRVLLAAMWQIQRLPWELRDGGAGSGIYRSVDGGTTWTKLTEGIPSAPLGRIALAIAPSNPDHVYALIESKSGMLWDSHDLGDHWTPVSGNHGLDVRPFYFSQIEVAPNDDEHVYFPGFQLLESKDGGKTTSILDRGVHVDHHALWIDPQDPDRMIQGNDGGVFVTHDGGTTWNFLDNLPIEQFYQVAVDDNMPYTLCGGLQDNNAWCGPSSGDRDGSEWYTVTGGDGEYAVPAPTDSEIIYVDSQNGSISRLDKKTGVRKSIRPYLPGVSDQPPSELKYRFNWTSPIAVAPDDANVVYLGGNVLFRSSDGGGHWEAISPDLTRNEKAHQVTSGGPVQYDISGAETYNTILSITVAPTDPNVIWVGTDDGLVQVTRDGGKTWTNVAGGIPNLPQKTGGRVYQIGVSPFDAGTAYIAVDFHMYDNNHPYVYRTEDYGKSWTDISRGLPEDAAAHVVREDPNHRGLLVLGTDNALYFSRNSGDAWQRFRSNFPTAPVWDLTFVKDDHDLVVATHGRGLFVLDNLTPLEQVAELSADSLQLFSILPARFGVRFGGGGPEASRFSVGSRPSGAMIDYYLPQEIGGTKPGAGPGPGRGRGPGGGPARSGRPGRPGGAGVKIVITDARGDTVASGDGPGKQGFNRYTWNLRYEGPTRLELGQPSGGGGGGFFGGNIGPRVVPGTYTVTVTAKGQTRTGTVQVEPDPFVPAQAADFRAQTQAGLKLRNDMSALNEMLNRIHGLEGQLANVRSAVKGAADSTSYAPVLAQADSLGKKLKSLKDTLYNSDVQRNAPEDDIHYLSRFHDQLQGLGFSVYFPYAQPPSEAVSEEMDRLGGLLSSYLDRFNALLATDVSGFNEVARSHGAPTLVPGQPLSVKPIPTLGP